jgi:hypothetical protein
MQRCDACQIFESDLTALEAVAKAVHSQPARLRFVQEIAGVRSPILNQTHTG